MSRRGFQDSMKADRGLPFCNVPPSTMQIYGIKEIKMNITALKRLISTAI